MTTQDPKNRTPDCRPMAHKNKAIVVGLVILSMFPVKCRDDRYRIVEHRIPVAIGGTTVDVVVHDSEAPGFTYLCLHDDENTSVEAVLDVIGRDGGRLVELRHTGDRNIVFELEGASYTFDPNRIFTDEGAEATLSRFGTVDTGAVHAVRSFANRILEIVAIERGQLLVAVHNNTGGEYSILSYMPGGEEAVNARFLHYPDKENPDDFFFVTDLELYGKIRGASINVVLQHNEEVADDGSLWVYASWNGIPYVNVVGHHGHVEQQIKMLEFFYSFRSEYVPTDRP